MNKSQLIDAVSQNAGLSKVDTKRAIDALIEVTKEELKKGEKISLVGFGTFSVSERSARKGLNPQTKQVIDIPAKKTPKFKAGSELCEAVK